MINKLKSACFTVLLFLCFVSCAKKETLSVDSETQSVVDNAIADQEFMCIVPASQQNAINTIGTGARSKAQALTCDTLTKLGGDTLWGTTGHIDPTYTMPVTNANCNLTLPDGKTRSGRLWIRLSNKLRLAGATMIIKLQEYKAGGMAFSCDSMIVTTISSSSLFTEFNVKLVNGLVAASNGNIRYNFNRTVKNYFFGNPAGTDPFASVYGSTNGVNTQGRVFTVAIPGTSPLVKHKSCQYIDKGVLELSPEGYKTRTVDFGPGNCDDEATFSVNNNTITFKLK